MPPRIFKKWNANDALERRPKKPGIKIMLAFRSVRPAFWLVKRVVMPRKIKEKYVTSREYPIRRKKLPRSIIQMSLLAISYKGCSQVPLRDMGGQSSKYGNDLIPCRNSL